MHYFEIFALSNIYLEDSFVLSISETSDSLIFELEAVLIENHPQYEEPKEDERYCYRKASLQFFNMCSIDWIDKRLMQYKDREDKVDYGNIDGITINDGSYKLWGDWGTVVVRGGEIEFAFTN
ncbi:hypothetical protein [Duffyella gerundensis]|uniref:hypothetical protein n=1 Tax=Duffyella TaxID=3026546 RepID=UPI003F6DB71C